jgi:rod shape-determining protein MreC
MVKKHFRLFLAFTVSSIILMTYQSRTEPFMPFQFLRTFLNTVNSYIESAETTVEDASLIVTAREEDIKELKEEIRMLKLEKMMSREAEEENIRLREVLALKVREPRFVASARVISRGSDRWSNTFVVDKGGAHRVEKDMAVVTPEGLLGKVFEVEEEFSRVLLIDDARFSVAVRLENARPEAVLRGAGPGKCELKYLETHYAVREHDVLITSGLDSLFPPGIPVGRVSTVMTSDHELFHHVEVVPHVDSRTVEEVIIIAR